MNQDRRTGLLVGMVLVTLGIILIAVGILAAAMTDAEDVAARSLWGVYLGVPVVLVGGFLWYKGMAPAGPVVFEAPPNSTVPPPASEPARSSGGATDPLPKGPKKSCPVCESPNEYQARKCRNCGFEFKGRRTDT